MKTATKQDFDKAQELKSSKRLHPVEENCIDMILQSYNDSQPIHEANFAAIA